jgi:hypothetical protein
VEGDLLARWKEVDVLEIDHAGLDAKELIRHSHENANKWIVDAGVFDVKTMDELVAEADTDRLEREGGRRSFVVVFHSDTESEDDEEDMRVQCLNLRTLEKLPERLFWLINCDGMKNVPRRGLVCAI